VKISIENDEGQKVTFFSFKSFNTHIVRLSCECCDTSEDVILDDHYVKVLRDFLKFNQEPKEREDG
jgi:hypothetical protein